MQNGIILLLAGICQGSFGLGYKKYKPFGWALFWQIYNIFCLCIAVGWTWMQAPESISVYLKYPGEAVVVLLCGVMWGISAICFTKGIDLLGMALLYGISMGISIIGGALFPILVHPDMAQEMNVGSLLVGLLLSAAGIILITIGGRIRERGQNGNHMKKGMWFAVCSGIGSALMNLGFGYGRNMNAAMQELGIGDIGISAASWLLVIFGGSMAATCYCLPQIKKNKMMRGLPQAEAWMTTAKLFVTAIIWYAALCLYGIFTCQAGESATVTGWVIFNALALIISNLWGIASGEWKNSGKALRYVFLGNVVMIFSWAFLAVV